MPLPTDPAAAPDRLSASSLPPRQLPAPAGPAPPPPEDTDRYHALSADADTSSAVVTRLPARLIASHVARMRASTLDAETHRCMGLLEQMATLGYLTSNSQDGLLTAWRVVGAAGTAMDRCPRDARGYGDAIDAVSRAGTAATPPEFMRQAAAVYESHGGVYDTPAGPHCKTQRAYLAGVMRRSASAAFVGKLNQTDMVAFRHGGGLPVTYEVSNSPWRHALVGEVPVSTSLPTGAPDAGMLRYELRCLAIPSADGGGLDSAIPDDLVVITCMDARHGRAADAPDGLFTAVVVALQAVDDAASSAWS